MLDFIAKYWLEVVFGLIVTGMGIAMKKIWKLYKNAQETRQSEEKERLLKEVDGKIQIQNERMQQADQELRKRMNDIENKIGVLTSGILSIQGGDFRHACKLLLEPGHVITMDEFEQITHDHEIYNQLGGNHIGDKYFEQVEKKFQSQVLE